MQPARDYPVVVAFDAPLEVARWRPLVHWFLAIPHWVVLYVYGLVAGIVDLLAWFAILFTGSFPPAMFDLVAGYQRYYWRVTSYVGFLREPYPPFDFTVSAADPGTDPARFSVERPERLSRGLIFVKWLLAIPHYFVLIFIGFGAAIAWLVAFFAVLFTGRWPEGLRAFVMGFLRWSYRVNAYVWLMVDDYPPFSLE
jgi:hypothetical protein